MTNNNITFIDIDETLFKTFASILVRDKQGNLLRELTNKEYNNYIPAENEVLDFSEFQCSDKFISTSIPIQPMIDILKKIFNLSKEGNSEVYLLTARNDLKDKDKFLKFFNEFGIEVGHHNDGLIHIIRAGKLNGLDNAGKKYNIIKGILNKPNPFTTVNLYDDAKTNLDKFLELRNDFSEMKVNAFMVEDTNIFPYLR